MTNFSSAHSCHQLQTPALMNRRNGMVGSLIRSHAVIGMSRKVILELLGAPMDPGADRKHVDVADYPLHAAMCGNAETNYLQILFKNDRAFGYRVYHQGEGYGDRKFVNSESYRSEDESAL